MTTSPPTSLIRLIAGGAVASVAAGLLGGIVLGLAVYFGSIIAEVINGGSAPAELVDSFGAAMLLYAIIGGSFGFVMGTPLAALLGHLGVWLTRAHSANRMAMSVMLSAFVTSIVVGIGNSITQLGTELLSGDGAASLIIMMTVSGAIAGAFGSFIFLIVRGWIVPPSVPSGTETSTPNALDPA